MQLFESFSFFERISKSDGAGNTIDEWALKLQTKAKLMYRQGSEAVMAARLEGRQPAFLNIRNSEAARQITTDWYCSNDRTGEQFNIRAVTVDTNNRQYVNLNIEAGVALG